MVKDVVTICFCSQVVMNFLAPIVTVVHNGSQPIVREERALPWA